MKRTLKEGTNGVMPRMSLKIKAKNRDQRMPTMCDLTLRVKLSNWERQMTSLASTIYSPKLSLNLINSLPNKSFSRLKKRKLFKRKNLNMKKKILFHFTNCFYQSLLSKLATHLSMTILQEFREVWFPLFLKEKMSSLTRWLEAERQPHTSYLY